MEAKFVRLSRHAQHHAQPRDGVSGGQEAKPGPAVPRGNAKVQQSQSRPTTNRLSANNLALAYQAAGKVALAASPRGIVRTQQSQAWPEPLHAHHHEQPRWRINSRRLDLALPVYEETFKHRKSGSAPDHPHAQHTGTTSAWPIRLNREVGPGLPLSSHLRLSKPGSAPTTPKHFSTKTTWHGLGGQKKPLAMPLFEKKTLRLRRPSSASTKHSSTATNLGTAYRGREVGPAPAASRGRARYTKPSSASTPLYSPHHAQPRWRIRRPGSSRPYRCSGDARAAEGQLSPDHLYTLTTIPPGRGVSGCQEAVPACRSSKDARTAENQARPRPSRRAQA